MGSMNNWLGFSSFSCADAVLHPSPQEWGGMKGVMAAADEEQPKLEDFLGMQEQAAEAVRSGAGSGVGATSIGLSMIKNWLRSQPAPAVGGDLMELSMSSPTDAEAGIGASPDGRGKVADGAVVEAAPRKAVDTFGQRTSIYRGVTKHRWTGRYEAHLWDNSCRREGQTRKGRQVYLGGYDKEEKAARAYDLAALKYWGTTTTTNFPVSDYEKEIKEMEHMNRQEYVASLRRKSSGFSRGASIYRGVTRHHQHGRWQARIGRVAGNKDLYLGTFCTQEEAAEAYDIAAIKFRGLNAVTNFDMSRYDVKSIIESSTLPISGTTKRLKDVPEHTDFYFMDGNGTDADNVDTSQLTNGIGSYSSCHYGYTGWSPIAMQPIPMQYPNGGQSRLWCKQEQDSADFAAAQNLHNLHYFPVVDSTQNFFQPSAVPDVMGVVEVPSPSLDFSSYMYNGGIGYHGAVGVGSYGTTVADVGRDDGYEQAVGSNSWVSSVPVIAQKSNVTVCHGAPLFSVWNDA